MGTDDRVPVVGHHQTTATRCLDWNPWLSYIGKTRPAKRNRSVKEILHACISGTPGFERNTVSKLFLTTKRLGFRVWSEDDFDLALGLWGDPEVTKLIDARGKLSEGQVRERLSQEISTSRSHGVQYWPVFLLENDEHVGCCGLRPYDDARNILEIGFHIRSQHWGRGYATEAARAVMAYAFEELEVPGLFAGHNPKNEASRHILEKLGFRYTHDELYGPTGLAHPCYLLMAEEYHELRQIAEEGG